jgi:hypothetical protein
MVGWLFAFILFSIGNPSSDFGGRWTMGAIRATVVVGAAAIPLALFIRIRFRPRIVRYRAEARRLRAAMSRASAPVEPEGSEPSGFEVLMDASAEVPSWIDVTRRGGLIRDPAAGLLFLVAVVWTFSLGSAAFSLAFVNPAFAAVMASAGLALSIGATVFYRRWKRRWDAETQRAHREWKGRVEQVRAAMDRYIEDL